MQHRKNYQISLFVIGCILINCLGKWTAAAGQLPVWMDSFGTVCSAYALGPFCGGVVGAATNVIYGFYYKTSYVYALTNIAVGILTGYYASKGYLKDLFKTMSLSFLITLLSVGVSVPLNYVFYSGRTGNIWGDGVIDLLGQMGLRSWMRGVIGEFYVDFLDKVVTLVAFFVGLRLWHGYKARQNEEKTPRISPNHMKTSIMIVFLLLGSVLGNPMAVSAQKTQDHSYNMYVQTIYNDNNGLPGGKANDIAQTKDGILWIGTYGGLYRYNGSRFQWMNHYDSVKNVNCLYTDEAGRLWIGTNDSGVSICINEEISNVVDSSQGLPADSVRCVTECSDGTFYVGTSDALAIVSLSGGLSVSDIVPEVTYTKSLSADQKDHVAAVTDEGSLYLLSQGKVIQHLQKKAYRAAYSCCMFDDQGRLYVGRTDNCIEIYKLKDGKLQKCRTVSCGTLTNIKSLHMSENQEIFICADNGAGFLDISGNYQSVNTNKFNSSIDHMLMDYQGNLWFTSSRLGLLRMCKSVFTETFTEAGLEEDVVNTVIKWRGDVYFGTDSGLKVVDGVMTREKHTFLSKKLEGIRVRCLMEDSQENLWICTSGEGVWKVSEDGSLRIYSEKDGLLGDKFRTAMELKDGTIALAGDLGISFVKNGTVTENIGASDGLSNPRVLCMFQKKDGTLLAGTDGNGIAVIRDHKVQSHYKKINGLSSEVILRMVKDTDHGGMFIVTSNSLCFMKNDKIRILDNFPYYNNYDIVEGKKGEVFVLSSAGIYVVDKKKLENGEKLDYDLLNATKGLQESLTPNAWNYIDKKDNLYLSGGFGAVYMNMNDYNSHNFSYRMLMKSIKMDGETSYVERGEAIHISRGVSRVEIIPEVVNYSINDPYVRVWLEGYDKEPTILPQSELKNIVYANLPTGEYIFHMAVYDHQRTKVIEESTYQIIKDKEIYDHWWFYVYYGIVLVLAIVYLTWLIVRTQIQKKLNLQKKELELARNQIQMGNETIITIARTVDAKDENTSQHSQRVSEYSVMIAEKLGYSKEDLEVLRKTALLHDIGKIAIPDRILNKAGRLTDEEYGVMKSHVLRGAEILKNFTFIEHVDEGALYHHERYDGKGYVNGLKGEEIPLNARIIGIADAFDAMTANRVYRKKLDLDFVLEELRKGRGTQFDPRLVDIMLGLLEDGTIDVEGLYGASESKIS